MRICYVRDSDRTVGRMDCQADRRIRVRRRFIAEQQITFVDVTSTFSFITMDVFTRLWGTDPSHEARNIVRKIPMRVEPKSYYCTPTPPSTTPRRVSIVANERTFLSWLKMAVALGGVSSAVFGYKVHYCVPNVSMSAKRCRNRRKRTRTLKMKRGSSRPPPST